MLVMILKHPVKMGNYSSKDNVISSLNELPNVTAEFVKLGFGKDFIAITIDEDEVDADDILSLGSYIGQIETMALMGS